MDEHNLSEIPRDIVLWLTDPVVLTVFAIVLGTMVTNFVLRRLLLRLDERVSKTATVWDDALVHALQQPLNLLVWVMGFSWAADVISTEADSGFAEIIEPGRRIAVSVVVALFLIRFLKEIEKGFILNGADVSTSNAVGKLLRVSVVITAALSILQTLGVSVSGVLAFGGVGGIAVGFAARDLLANFFGGLMIYLDRPFAVGDWVRSPDRNIEGTVERIGWRLTAIRTFDSRPLYIPNSVFANIAVENPSRMRNRRIYETIGVRYADVDRIKGIVDEVRTMLEQHDEIDHDRTLIVNFNEFGASSLNFFVYTFTRTTNWVEFHGVKERLLLAIIAIIESHGAECAFPTQTIHFAHGEPPPSPSAD